MVTPDENNTNGVLNGNGVGIALAAIFVGVGLAVAFIASDGAIFGQIFQSAPSNTGLVDDSSASPPEAEGEAAVTSRDVLDQGSGGDVSGSVSQPDASRTNALPGKENNNSATQAEQRQLLAIKNFPWSSVAVEQITSSQNIMNKFKQQDEAQQKPAQPELESLFLADEISVDVDRDRDRDRDRDDNVAGDDVSLADVIDILPIDIQVIDDGDQERPDEEQPSDTGGTSEDQQDGSADNEEQGNSEDDSTSNEGESPEEDDSGSGSGDDEEQSSDSGSSSNSTATQGPSEDSGNESENDGNGGNSTGTEVTISLG